MQVKEIWPVLLRASTDDPGQLRELPRASSRSRPAASVGDQEFGA
jgi:hypothetical protein